MIKAVGAVFFGVVGIACFFICFYLLFHGAYSLVTYVFTGTPWNPYNMDHNRMWAAAFLTPASLGLGTAMIGIGVELTK